MILIIKTNKEKLHDYEFVKPIEDILKDNKKEFFTKHYGEVKEEDLKKVGKVIICGTSLKDNNYNKDLKKFDWIKEFDGSLLGICAGMQIVGGVFGCKIKKGGEIGYFHERFEKDFLGLNEEVQVYHLHNNYIDVNKDFEVFSSSKFIQAVKLEKKEIYLTLFHPEVRNKELIKNFIEL
jgi:GMP synthase (glutamine-hydrolysing)